MKIGRIIAFVALLIVGLLGLAMSVCGGGVLFILFSSPGSASGSLFFGAIALGSVVIGLSVLFVVWRAMRIAAEKEDV